MIHAFLLLVIEVLFMTVSSSLEKIIDNVSNAISEQALFFSEILTIYCSPELEYELHQYAQFKLKSTLRFFGNTSINLNRLPVLSRRTLQSYVLLSISVITYKKYDGKIWEHKLYQEALEYLESN